MKHSSSVAFSVNSKVSFKVIIVGDLAVGKTSLVMRYIKDMFSKEYKVTVGFEFFSKVVKHGEEDVTVQIWDTAGQEAFRSMIRSFYRSAACVILAFSMAKPETLESLNKWIQQVKQFSSQHVVKVLVGTKSDLISNDNKWVSAKADQFYKANKLDLFMQISSKTALNVQQLFRKCVEIMYKRFEENDEYRELVLPNKVSFVLPETGDFMDDDKQETNTGKKIGNSRAVKRDKEGGGCC